MEALYTLTWLNNLLVIFNRRFNSCNVLGESGLLEVDCPGQGFILLLLGRRKSEWLFLLSRRNLNSIGVIMAVYIPLGRRIKILGRRIKDFFLSWAGEIRRSPGQNKILAWWFNTFVVEVWFQIFNWLTKSFWWNKRLPIFFCGKFFSLSNN